MVYEVISQGVSWGMFKTREEAYNFAVNRIKALKLFCGEIYVPYEIVERLGFRLCQIG